MDFDAVERDDRLYRAAGAALFERKDTQDCQLLQVRVDVGYVSLDEPRRFAHAFGSFLGDGPDEIQAERGETVCELIGVLPTANDILYWSYHSDMYGTVRESLEDWYNPSIQSAIIVLMGSSFCLYLFLNSPDFTNPYYVFGVGVMGFTIVFAALMLISMLLKRR